MKARYKAPSGTGIIEFADDTTVSELFAQIRSQTGLSNFTIKYGWPIQTLDEELGATPAKLLNLNGQSFTIVPPAGTSSQPPAPASDPNRAPLPSTRPPEDVTVPWPAREGTLLLRVMPSDNSCLFTAFGGVLPNPLPPLEMRIRIAEHILAMPEKWDKVTLGMEPDEYCRKITTPEYWGGAIELAIFSDIFDVEICTFDVGAKTLMRFGEGQDKQTRCILIYSGIHYDRVAFSPTEPPYVVSDLPAELDRTMWETTDEEVLEKAARLVDQLHEIHYYTDPNELILKCNHPGCDWLGSGQTQGQQHARRTGHTDLSEVGDNLLLKCKVSGCDWLGGLEDSKKHGAETGHTKLEHIPDDR